MTPQPKSGATPGPWAISPDDRPGMAWNNHIVQVTNPNMAICFMTHTGRADNSECQANARLISAAPDLLAALQSALRHAEEMREAWRSGEVSSCNGRSGHFSNMNIEVETQARAAIAKATQA